MQKKHSTAKEIYLIEPTLVPMETNQEYVEGVSMKLPIYVCVADLSYHVPVKDMKKAGSSLTVVWFQNNYAFPIDYEIIEKFKSIQWSKLAIDYDFD